MFTKYMKSAALIALCIVLIFSCFSCAKMAEDKLAEENVQDTVAEDKQNEQEQVQEKPVETKPETKPEPEPEPEPEPKIINPLTGEEVAEDTSMNRPIAFMMNNISYAMPQLGVSNADIIYEMIVEGGITRMFAVFQNLQESDIIGSIRSARHNYLDLVKAYDALYVHAGGSSQAYDELVTRDIDNVCAVTGRGDIFYRDPYRLEIMDYEHTLCITGESALNYFKDESGYRLTHDEDYKCNMVFSDNVKPVDGEIAETAYIDFGLGKYTTFYYNTETGKYSMSQYGDTYIDGNTYEAIEFKNIIVIQTEVISLDASDHKEITLTGTGNGWFICNGEIAEITWSRTDNDAQFEYTYSDGTPLEYGVGKTYVGVISNYGSVEAE